MVRDCDIVVLGAGPAGVATALGLAGLGYRIALLDRPRRFPSLEGLSERALAGLHHLSCMHTLDEVTIEAQRSAWWNGLEFDGNREWLLDRSRFDRALREDARAADIRIVPGRAGRIEWRADHWRIESAATETLQSRYLIDARGRSSPRDRQGRRGPLTVALGQYWRLDHPEPAITRVLPFTDGWLWYAGCGNGRALVQLFVDARLPPRVQLATHYANILERIASARDWLHSAIPLGEPHARHAHMQCATEVIDTRQARVGDAALALDPLSGHGIYQALAGAMALIPAVHTLLARSGDPDSALAFYRERIAVDFQRMARLGRDFYRQEQRWPERDFWRLRRTWPDDEPVHGDPSAPARIETKPVSCDGVIETREVIVSADQPRGVWRIDGVALVPLLRWYRETQHTETERAPIRYAQHAALAPNACRRALAWLHRRGLLN